MSVWEYVGFGDVLKEPSSITRNVIKPLHQKYRSLSSTPVSQQSGAAFQKKRAEFLESLSKLFDISNRKFLLHHWDTQIFFYLGLQNQGSGREEACPAFNPDSSEKLLPTKPRREPCTPRSTGTTITVHTDISKKIRPATDR